MIKVNPTLLLLLPALLSTPAAALLGRGAAAPTRSVWSRPKGTTSPNSAALDPHGDPSLTLHVNVKIPDKLEFMKKASKILAAGLSKPESYVAIAVVDEVDMVRCHRVKTTASKPHPQHARTHTRTHARTHTHPHRYGVVKTRRAGLA